MINHVVIFMILLMQWMKYKNNVMIGLLNLNKVRRDSKLASLIPIPQVTYTMGSSSGVASSAIDTSYM